MTVRLYRVRPVILEAAYTPEGEPRSPLQQTAIAAGCEAIDGRMMLVEQGLAQWELWTGQVRCSAFPRIMCPGLNV